jgi:cytochrome c peroxidase
MLFSRSTWVGCALAAGSILPVVGCTSDKIDGFSNEEWQRVSAIAPLATKMPDNPFDKNHEDEDPIARFGQRLFFDKRGAEAITVDGPSGKAPYTLIDSTTGMPVIDPVTMMPKVVPGEKGKVSCATCHGSTYLVDPRPFPISHGRSWLAHNTPTMANLGYLKSVLWTGRFDSLREHGAGALGGAATTMAQIHFIYNFHRDEYNTLFPNTPLDPALDPTATDASRFPVTGNPKGATTVNGKTVMGPDGAFEKMTAADRWAVYQFKGNMGIVFEAHPRKLNTPGSKFERYVHDEDASALSDSAKNGLRLFIGKASCIDCHNGPALSDGQYHNIGVPTQKFNPPPPYSNMPGAPDRGRGGALIAGLNNQLMQLRTNEMLAPMDQVPIFGGAGQYSDDPVEGLKRLVDQDRASCITRSTDPADVTAACQALFFPGTPEDTTKTPTVPAKPADPRLQVCIDRNTMPGTDICTAYDPEFEGAFRTPILLNINETGPYFHTGEYATLRDVVNHYNQGGGIPGTFVGTKSPRLQPLGLTDSEVGDIVEFLKSLTGNPPDPDWICDPSLPPAAAGVASVANGPCAAPN